MSEHVTPGNVVTLIRSLLYILHSLLPATTEKTDFPFGQLWLNQFVLFSSSILLFCVVNLFWQYFHIYNLN